MPLKEIQEINSNTFIGIWEITENVNRLLLNIKLSAEEKACFNQFKVDVRRKQWLAYRHVIRELLKAESVEIVYDKSGKPRARGFKHYISISHSGDYAVVIISESQPVGIDIEQISKRITKVKNRFLSDGELNSVSGNDELEKCCIYWCAKEALYKLYGKEKLDFKENILIEPFSNNTEVSFTGIISNKEIRKEYNLYYQKIRDYFLVYVLG